MRTLYEAIGSAVWHVWRNLSGNRSKGAVGASRDPLSGRIPLPDVPVTRQTADNTCVPCALQMLLDSVAPGRVTVALEGYRLSPRGLHPADMAGIIDSHLEQVGLRYKRGDLRQAIRSKRPFLAVVSIEGEGHAVLVQEARNQGGKHYLLVRDPAHGAYLEEVKDFNARLVTNPESIGPPTFWGEP